MNYPELRVFHTKRVFFKLLEDFEFLASSAACSVIKGLFKLQQVSQHVLNIWSKLPLR